MGEMAAAALWGYEENHHHDMEQLGQKLVYTTLELEKLKWESMEEMRKNKEYINQLIHLLKYAIQERDEARTQLHNLNLLLLHDGAATVPLFKPPLKANSSVTESNSLSETHNHHSHASSPAVDDSLFDGVSSTEFPNPAAMILNNNNIQQVDPVMVPRGVVVIDRGSFVIDNLVRGRVLPQKGKLLQAVLRAGPLLQTLLVAGPLPRWRNPPQFQPYQMPSPPPPPLMSIGGCEALSSSSNVMSFANGSLMAKRQRFS